MPEIGSGSGSGYPAALDTDTSQEVNSPGANKTKARAEVINDLGACVVAIETALGTSPQGTKTDVKTFLQIDHNTDGTHKTGITLTQPTIGDFTNANHAHTSTATGGVIAVGKLVQIAYAETAVVITSTTALPYDNTIPQNTEGTEVITATITPTSVSNKLIISGYVPHSISSGNAQAIAAIFQDTTANALGANSRFSFGANLEEIGIQVYMASAGTTSATTFKLRFGIPAATATYINGKSDGTGLFGGVLKSWILIQEIKP